MLCGRLMLLMSQKHAEQRTALSQVITLPPIIPSLLPGHQGGHAAPARLRTKRLCWLRAARGGGLWCGCSCLLLWWGAVQGAAIKAGNVHYPPFAYSLMLNHAPPLRRHRPRAPPAAAHARGHRAALRVCGGVLVGWGGWGSANLVQRTRFGGAPPGCGSTTSFPALPEAISQACPGGCIGGGGQPKSDDPLLLLKRMGAGEGVEG